jgi:alpha-L-rhamnosidase
VLSPLLKPGAVTSDNLAAPNGGFYSLSYSIHFLNALYDYYLYTGDLNLVAALWPAVQGELAYLRSTANPQANPQAPDLVTTDASNGMDWNVNTQIGTVTEYNALYYRALTNAAALAQALGHMDEGAALTQLAALVKSEVNATLFDAAAGRYDLSNLDRTTVAQDANILAVLYGVALPDRTASVLQSTEAALQTPHGPRAFSSGSGANVISPFISGFDVYAHFEAGDAAGALALIRTVWVQHMTHDKPFYSGAVFETLNLDGTPENPTRTLSHAWGSGPTSALSKYVLGVRPVEPGYKTWLVEPQPGDLSWAEGTVPTPQGPVGVAWYRGTPGFFGLGVWVPAGTRGTVGLPVAGANALLSDNGRIVAGLSASQQPNGRAGYLYLRDVSPGLHWIQATTSGQ